MKLILILALVALTACSKSKSSFKIPALDVMPLIPQVSAQVTKSLNGLECQISNENEKKSVFIKREELVDKISLTVHDFEGSLISVIGAHFDGYLLPTFEMGEELDDNKLLRHSDKSVLVHEDMQALLPKNAKSVVSISARMFEYKNGKFEIHRSITYFNDKDKLKETDFRQIAEISECREASVHSY